MLNTSSEWEQAIINDNRRFLNRAQIISPNGSGDWQITVNSDRIMQGGAQFSNGTTSVGNFDIGATVIGKYTLLLQNYNDQFTNYLFEGATVIAYVGLELESGTEWIRKGTYIVNDAKFSNGIVTLTCYDNLNKFARNIPNGFVTSPITLGELSRRICSYCGVVLATNNLEMKNYMISSIGEQITFLDAIGFIAQIEGAFARCNPLGQLEIAWYDEINDGAGGLDGGTFDFIEGNTSYHDGDVADGGSFNPWNVGFEFDAGDFIDMSKFWVIVSYTSSNIDIEDVVPTGIQIEHTNGDEPYEILAGSEGYIISITNNEFITKDTASSVANHLKGKIAGMRFRPLRLSILGNPAMEAGDNAYVVDRKGRAIQCLLTNIDYTIGNKATISCDAMSATRNSADRNSAMTRAIVQARKNTADMISVYDLAMQQLTSLMSLGMGLFPSRETLEDGSTIFYMHNKPLLDDSMTIWKMTADAFAVSTDGGHTWNAGIDSSGNVLVNVLSAIGINFDWARGGTLTLGGENDSHGVLNVLNRNGALTTILGAYGLLFYDDQGILKSSANHYGYNFYNGDTQIGALGTVRINHVTAGDINTLGVNLAYGDNMFNITTTPFDDSPYTRILAFIYSPRDNMYSARGFHFYDDINMHGWSITNTSDERLKENIVDSGVSALDVVNDVKTYSYDWLVGDEKHEEVGFVAQQVESVTADLVEIDSSGMYSINETKMMRYLWKAVQELSEKVEVLEAKLEIQKKAKNPKRREWSPNASVDKIKFAKKYRESQTIISGGEQDGDTR